MNGTWQAIQTVMREARETRQQGGDSGPVLARLDTLRTVADPVPGQGALLDLIAATTRGPVVVGQLGQTLDGRIATDNGHSRYVNGTEALDHLHRLRALVDAVVIGAGTLHQDDPALTVRRCSGQNPVRVVVAGARPLPRDRRLFCDGLGTLVTGADLPSALGSDGEVDPRRVLAGMSAMGLDTVLVEGGARTVSRFLAAGCLDRLHLLVAPTVLGSGRAAFALETVTSIDRAMRFNPSLYPLGADFLFDLTPDPGATDGPGDRH